MKCPTKKKEFFKTTKPKNFRDWFFGYEEIDAKGIIVSTFKILMIILPKTIPAKTYATQCILCA